MTSKTTYIVIAALLAAGIIFLSKIKECTPVESIVHTRDSVVQYIVRTDTVRVPRIIYKKVLAERLDSTPCPVIEYFSDINDTVRIIADCQNAVFPLIDIRPQPVIHRHTDTIIKVKEFTKEVKAFRPMFDVLAYGGHDVLRRVWGAGVSGGIHFHPLSLVVSAEYYNDLALRAEFHYTLLER